jgi:hypothetical protein
MDVLGEVLRSMGSPFPEREALTPMTFSLFEESRTRFNKIVRQNKLDDVELSVLVKTLTPEEAIGEPGRRDFPIVLGKERVIEAEILGCRAHAFTDSTGEFLGRLRDVLAFPLSSSRERAIHIATMNAVLKHLNMVRGTIHCRDQDPVRCAKEIAASASDAWGRCVVGLIGLNPAIAEALGERFGFENLRVTDLNQANIGRVKYGVEIWDGRERTEELIRHSALVVLTGTTLVNGTFDRILQLIRHFEKDYLIYGVTGAGVCRLMGLNRICPYGRDE